MWGWGSRRSDNHNHGVPSSQSADSHQHDGRSGRYTPPKQQQSQQQYERKSWRKLVPSKSTSSLRPKSNPMVGRRRFRVGGGGGQPHADTAAASAANLSPHAAARAVSPTTSHEVPEGIEVTLSQEQQGTSSNSRANRRGSTGGSLYNLFKIMPTDPVVQSQQPLQQRNNGVWSLEEQLSDLKKIHRAQFKIDYHAALAATNTAAAPKRASQHRIPMAGVAPPQQYSPQSIFDEVVSLMRGNPTDERALLQQELQHLDQELEAIRRDKSDLQRRTVHLPAADLIHSNDNDKLVSWDVHGQLVQQQQQSSTSSTAVMAPAKRRFLQAQRGLSLTVSLCSTRAHEMLLSKCGCKQTIIKAVVAKGATQKSPKSIPKQQLVTTIRPDMVREEGTGVSTIQHVVLLPNHNTKSGGRGGAKALDSSSAPESSSFLLSRDDGKSFYWGRLPDRLFRRIQSSGGGRNNNSNAAADIVYLSTGPLGSYYCEFRSGACWWGTVSQDANDFDVLLSTWNVYRVVFGPCTWVLDATGRRHLATSYLIISRDGRVAWKNLPPRLHLLLESRMASQAAPTEVALGYGGAYFIRFGDGCTDYQLPAHLARVCKGLEIFSMSLHPEMPHDFLIRHA